MHLGLKTGGRWLGWAVLALAIVCLPLTGCGSGSDGEDGQDGQDGAPGSSTGTLAGTVTNAVTGNGISGVTVSVSPTGATTTTGASGGYSFNGIAIGAYTVSVSPSGYGAQTQNTGVVANGTTTVDFDLTPNTMVAVSIAISGDPTPGGSVTATANVTPYDGSTPTAFNWTQLGDLIPAHAGGGVQVPVLIDSPASQSTTITFGSAAEYKQALRSWVHTPERWDVLPISPYALEEGDGATLECEVTTGTGTYTTTATVHVHLDFATWASGIRNVPIGLPVLLNGKTQATYNWALTTPAGSAATLNDATTVNPWFVPDIVGLYTLTVTDLADGPKTVEVYAGTWRGVITGETPTGLPQPDAACTGCHQPGGFADGNQFADWQMSGHAEIFTTNVNFSTHYSTSCFPCHTVGYNTDADNGGFDDASDYQDFLDEIFPGGHHHPDAGNWSWMIGNTPDTAQLGNIQCENCHGPQDGGGAHINKPGEPRVSVRSDVCGFCHGEPPRHGRFQQWQESPHGNYELAMEEGGSSCSKCHTGQGFVNFYYNGTGGSYTADQAHPQTCVVCHDPHFVGTVSGAGNDANLRVYGDVPATSDFATYGNYISNEGGFDVHHAGKGAMCISCHNSRRGIRNDTVDWSTVSDKDREPHQGPQTDMLYGQNAYFVQTGVPGAHAFLSDTCVTCHLELTAPPEDYSYAGGGTNHAFGANLDICSECHGAFDGGSLQDQVADGMHELELAVAEAIEDEIAALIGLGHTVDVSGYDDPVDESNPINTTIGAASTFSVDHVAGSHGRSAFDITVDGTTYYHVQLNGGTSISGGGSLVNNSYFAPAASGLGQPEILAKAAWNLNFIHLDRSEGVHNPSFVIDIFVGTFQKLEELTW